MKKIAAIFDGLKFSNSTLQHAFSLVRKEAAYLSGVFPDDPIYNSFNMNSAITSGATAERIKELEQLDEQKRAAAAQAFAAAATQEGIAHNVHRTNCVPIQEVLHQSTYADLLVIGARESFLTKEQEPPTEFIRSLLSETRCPVLLVPEAFSEIRKIVLLYDGEPSSIHAIKMCCYVMPALSHLPVEVVSVKEAGSDSVLESDLLMREFLQQHFPQATYKVLTGTPSETILQELRTQPDGTLVVLGAYQRGAVSRWLRESMADFLMRELALPLFIAHNK
jgi:nucleotide-binding universal stress UspA family protein